jgi:hypothetical protein
MQSTERVAGTKRKRSNGAKLTADTKRVNVNFARRTYEALLRIAERKGGSMSEALRQAIMLTDFIEAATDDGARVLIDRDKGQIQELVIR